MKVIIVGGGMTGASLALAISALSKEKIQISLIEIKLRLYNKVTTNIDTRTIALAYGTCQQFNQIGIWSCLKKYVTPICNIHVSEYGYTSTVNMKANDYSLPAFGYVIQLHYAENCLFEQLRKTKNVKLYCPDKVIAIERTINYVSVKLASGKVLIGQLLVAADGTFSMIGKSCKIEWHREYYQQCAIITNILTSKKTQEQAFERLTKYGLLAILPISKRRSSLIWCHPLEKIKYIMQCNDSIFIAKLQKLFGWQLGEIQAISKRYYFPLLFSQAKRLISHRLVLVGNAAQTLHPIAGQGFNLGMRDIMIFANIISQVANNSGDIGAYSVLMEYQTQRIDDRQNTIKLINNLIYLFTNNHLVFSIGRNIGLIVLETLPLIRNILAHQIMGRYLSPLTF
ncbi:MAG: 2-octaprenyl-6-methoxyphenyl hydroxylase [Arsenophonus sp. ET-DL9-MAG3]